MEEGGGVRVGERKRDREAHHFAILLNIVDPPPRC